MVVILSQRTNTQKTQKGGGGLLTNGLDCSDSIEKKFPYSAIIKRRQWNNKRGLKSGKLLWGNKRRAQITFSGSAPSQIKLYCYFNLILL